MRRRILSTNFLDNGHNRACLAIILTGLSLFCFSANASHETFFEGGPGLYELIYTNPLPPGFQDEKLLSPREKAQRNIDNWMQIYKNNGVNLFGVSLLSREGIYICTSQVLKEAGFRHIKELGDIFPLVLEKAKKYNLAISISLDDLAQIINGAKPYRDWLIPTRLSPRSIGELILELATVAKEYGVSIWINEASFGPTYQKVLAATCREHNFRYIRYFGQWEGYADIFCSEDYATYPIAPESKPGDADYLYNLARCGSAYGRIGYLNMMFGRANALGKQTGVLTAGGWGLTPGCQHNVALYRAVQFAPSLYCFYSAPDDEQDIKFVRNFNYGKQLVPLLKKFARSPEDSPKAVGNLILDLPEPPFTDQGAEIFDNALSSSAEAITNALTASGFELVVSIRKPLTDARIYYIFTAGSSPKLDLYRDISDSLLPAFTQQNSPVYLQCALGLPRGPNWRKIAPLLGLPIKTSLLTCSDRFLSPIPSHCNFSFPNGTDQVQFRGYHFWINTPEESGKLAIYHHLNDIPFREIDSDVAIISMGEIQGKTLPLLTRRKNYFFVNGNFIHFNFSNVLCNLMSPSPVFYSPASVYLTRGEQRSTIFSAADTFLDIAFTQTGTIHHWQSDGTAYPDSPLHWKDNRLQGGLKKWELIVILTDLSKSASKPE